MVCKSDKKVSSPDSEEVDREDLSKLSRQNSGEKSLDQSLTENQKHNQGIFHFILDHWIFYECSIFMFHNTICILGT